MYLDNNMEKNRCDSTVKVSVDLKNIMIGRKKERIKVLHGVWGLHMSFHY